MSSLSPHVMEQLVLIKQVYQLADRQSRLRFPTSAIAVLLFHDAVELFTALVVEVHNLSRKTGIDFMQYWDLITNLGMKPHMDRLNTARKSLKHKGNLPAESSIEVHRVHVLDFLVDHTPKYFGVRFETVSLAHLTDPQEVRDLLLQAQDKLEQNGNLAEAVTDITKAFLRVTGRGSVEPMLPPFYNPFRHETHELRRWADSIAEDLLQVREQVRMILLGLDFKDYSRFKSIIPTVYQSHAGTFEVRHGPGYAPSREQVEFAFQFVVQTALRIKERGLEE